jgi:hypothetical protein
MNRGELEAALRVGEPLDAIGRRHGLSADDVRQAAARFGLPSERELKKAEIDVALKAGRRSLQRHCPQHGITEFALVGARRRLHCKRCRAEAVVRRRRRVKRMLVDEAGGACVLCGYDDHLAALEFHHRDPKTKSLGLARRGITRSFEEVRREAQKCILVCANCHAAIEVGAIEVPVQLRSVIDPSRGSGPT